MKFQQHYSGSTGNFYTVTASNGNRILLECGVPLKKMLKSINHNSKGIEGCFVSHEHKDHSKSIKDVTRTGIDVYANESTLKAHGLLGKRRSNKIENNLLVKLPSFHVYCFDVNHDVPALGFIIHEVSTGEKLLFITDTSHITQKFKFPFSIIAIEANYDKRILNRAVKNESINVSHATRLLESHMEKTETMRYLKNHVDMSQCHELHLLHLSDGNIDAEKTREEFTNKFFIDVQIVGE